MDRSDLETLSFSKADGRACSPDGAIRKAVHRRACPPSNNTPVLPDGSSFDSVSPNYGAASDFLLCMGLFSTFCLNGQFRWDADPTQPPIQNNQAAREAA
jgi:hypothetical protein